VQEQHLPAAGLQDGALAQRLGPGGRGQHRPVAEVAVAVEHPDGAAGAGELRQALERPGVEPADQPGPLDPEGEEVAQDVEALRPAGAGPPGQFPEEAQETGLDRGAPRPEVQVGYEGQVGQALISTRRL
jgi:hypothetical protein